MANLAFSLDDSLLQWAREAELRDAPCIRCTDRGSGYPQPMREAVHRGHAPWQEVLRRDRVQPIPASIGLT